MSGVRFTKVLAAAAAALVLGAATVSAQAAQPTPKSQAAAPAKKAAPAKPAQEPDSRDQNLSAYIELLRSDIRTQKVAILTQVMQFSEAEDAKFWPIYRQYDVELSALNDERIALIKEYAANYEAMTDAAADKIASGALALEGKRNALKQKYYDRIKTALSAKTAARFLQVENQILMLLDLQISAALPVVR